jgi:hypothetical protein
MENDWTIRFREFIAEFLREVRNLPCKEVTWIDQEVEEWWDYSDAHGYHCYLEVYWTAYNGKEHVESIQGGIEDLLRHA